MILSWVSVERIRVSEYYFESQYLLRSSIRLLHVYCYSFAKLCPSFCNHLDCSTPGSCPPLSLRVCSRSCPLMMPSNHLILCHPLLLLPSIFPSIRTFSNGSALCIRWPQYGSFSFSISPSNEYSGLIFFRMDWLDLLVFQRTLKNLLPHHSSKT